MFENTQVTIMQMVTEMDNAKSSVSIRGYKYYLFTPRSQKWANTNIIVITSVFD